MNKSIALLVLALLWNTAALAGETLYEIRVDGLACPYCAYGIEKKLDQIDGVKFLDLDLEKGIVELPLADAEFIAEQIRSTWLPAIWRSHDLKRLERIALAVIALQAKEAGRRDYLQHTADPLFCGQRLLSFSASLEACYFSIPPKPSRFPNEIGF